MAYLGMLSLGAFIGTIITLATLSTTNWSDVGKVLTDLIGAAFTGGVFTFIQFLGGKKIGEGLFLYPVGLVLGMMWVYSKTAMINITSEKVESQILGWLHILGLVLMTLAALAILFTSKFRSMLPK